MPTYQYACTECGHAFEQFQSFTDDALTVCPVCEGRLRKVFNAVGVVFKGSGFYRTDSRQDGPKNGSSGDKSGSGSEGDSGTTGSKEPSKSTGSKESPAASGSTGTTSTSSPSTSGSTSAA